MELLAIVDTPGLGRGTFACRPHRRLTINSFLKATREEEQGDSAPADLKVAAEIEYPDKKKGKPAERHVLEKRC
jgi:hypothetical protein